jgi:hypothetical protein
VGEEEGPAVVASAEVDKLTTSIVAVASLDLQLECRTSFFRTTKATFRIPASVRSSKIRSSILDTHNAQEDVHAKDHNAIT